MMNKNEKNIIDYLFFQEGPGVRNYQYTTSGVKLLNVSNLVDGELDLSNSCRYISDEEAYGKYKHFLCDAGDLIIASSGIKADYFDKKMGFVREEMLPLCMNTSTIRFKSLNETDLNIKYFMYYLKSNHFRKQLEYNLTGSAQLNFGPSHLKKMKFIYHNISKQKEIVKKLDFVSYMINLKQEQITKFDELIKSQFVEMFENRDYEKLSGKELFSFSSGKFLEASKRLENGVPVYGGNGVAWYTDEPLIDFNTIVIGRVGAYCGNVKSIKEPVWITDNAIFIKQFKKDVYNIDFLYYMMELVDFSRFAQFSGQPKITQKPLEEFNYVVPPIEEQIKFSNIVKLIDKQKFEFENSLKKLEELQFSLMQEYFG